MALLSISTDAKTIKGEQFGVLTGILYLAPFNTVNGINTCPMAEIAGCFNACLYTAGRGAFNNVQLARIKRTELFRDNRQDFMIQLIIEINQLIRKANKLGLIPAIRLNGTSDIKWENIGFEFNGIQFENVMQLFPNVQFYDYTKIPNRNPPSNYDLTFSYSGVTEFNKYNQQAINKRMRIAVVFDSKQLPESFNGLNVINGDDSDIRFNDPQNTIVGLYAKGKAKRDKSGFVIPIKSINATA